MGGKRAFGSFVKSQIWGEDLSIMFEVVRAPGGSWRSEKELGIIEYFLFQKLTVLNHTWAKKLLVFSGFS